MTSDNDSGIFADLMDIENEVKPKEKSERSKDIKISEKISRYQDIKISDNIEDIRSIVKDVGRETSPLRITTYETERLEDALHQIKKKQKLKSDKNQVVRIALNNLLADYEKNGKDSILVQVLERLNA